jgi:hypothetical protein
MCRVGGARYGAAAKKTFKAAGEKLSPLFDGTEQLVSLTSGAVVHARNLSARIVRLRGQTPAGFSPARKIWPGAMRRGGGRSFLRNRAGLRREWRPDTAFLPKS